MALELIEGKEWELTFSEPDDGQQRFTAELEFVQCLANPEYIHCECPPFVKEEALLLFSARLLGRR